MADCTGACTAQQVAYGLHEWVCAAHASTAQVQKCWNGLRDVAIGAAVAVSTELRHACNGACIAWASPVYTVIKFKV